MNSFLLVRHGEAASQDPGAALTPLGRQQAEAVANRLRGWRFDAAWSSDLRRAKETAEAILRGREGPPLKIAKALREVEIPSEVVAKGVQSEQYARWEKEAVEALASSLLMWLREVEQSGERRSTVLVISHGGPLRVLICLLLGLPPEMHWSFRLDCAGLTIVERGDGMGTITLLNDRCHLDAACVRGYAQPLVVCPANNQQFRLGSPRLKPSG